MYKNMLVTGGCGFIGSHFVRYLIKKYPQIKVVNVDLLTYCDNLESINWYKNNQKWWEPLLIKSNSWK